MSQQFGADPRTVRLGSDFKEVRLLLERNPNRLFDVWCSMLRQTIACSTSKIG